MDCSSSVAAQGKTEEVEELPEELPRASFRAPSPKPMRSKVLLHGNGSGQSTAGGSSSSADGQEGAANFREQHRQGSAGSGELYLEFPGTSKSGGSDLTAELIMSREVEANQAEGKDFCSWNTGSVWKRNHLRHEDKLNTFLQSIAPDDMEEKVTQRRVREFSRSHLSPPARPQICLSPHLDEDDSFPSSVCSNPASPNGEEKG
ncbi:unnamed protein product [Polarella glacialis]|uniref:Uncharacterized protein n=1 Tax=Polarella glacialis TaxID=89957 RepID=A0A813JEJ2_POLGL|nr:unnamed protein product [Polarella glacialis]